MKKEFDDLWDECERIAHSDMLNEAYREAVRQEFRAKRIHRILLSVIWFAAVFGAIFGLSGCSRDTSQSDYSEEFDIVCVDGFQFYKRTAIKQGYLANKLAPDGRPVPCEAQTNQRP